MEIQINATFDLDHITKRLSDYGITVLANGDTQSAKDFLEAEGWAVIAQYDTDAVYELEMQGYYVARDLDTLAEVFRDEGWMMVEDGDVDDACAAINDGCAIARWVTISGHWDSVLDDLGTDEAVGYLLDTCGGQQEMLSQVYDRDSSALVDFLEDKGALPDAKELSEYSDLELLAELQSRLETRELLAEQHKRQRDEAMAQRDACQSQLDAEQSEPKRIEMLTPAFGARTVPAFPSSADDAPQG